MALVKSIYYCVFAGYEASLSKSHLSELLFLDLDHLVPVIQTSSQPRSLVFQCFREVTCLPYSGKTKAVTSYYTIMLP